MTPKQTQLYWRLWGRACDVNNWRMQKGRLAADATPNPQSAIRNPQLNTVLSIAANLARAHHRSTTPDDLRHACHFLAAGRDCSSADLTNPQLDKFYNLCRLLADPSDLDASIALENPDIGARRRLVVSIQKSAPEFYIQHICQDQFAGQYTSPFWEDLPIASLRALALTIRNRTANGTRPIPAPVAASVRSRKLDPAPAPEPLDCPY